jgi:C4-type zinc ribbon domain
MPLDRLVNQSLNVTRTLRDLARLEEHLSTLPAGAPISGAVEREIESLRDLLPTSILGHYDRLKARGKLGLAAVARGVCGACHLAVPRGKVADLRRAPQSLNVCDNCGTFIYLADEDLMVTRASARPGGLGPPQLRAKARVTRKRTKTTRPKRSPKKAGDLTAKTVS